MFVHHNPIADSITSHCSGKEHKHKKGPAGPWCVSELKPVPNEDFSSYIGARGLEKPYIHVYSLFSCQRPKKSWFNESALLSLTSNLEFIIKICHHQKRSTFDRVCT